MDSWSSFMFMEMRLVRLTVMISIKELWTIHHQQTHDHQLNTNHNHCQHHRWTDLNIGRIMDGVTCDPRCFLYSLRLRFGNSWWGELGWLSAMSTIQYSLSWGLSWRISAAVPTHRIIDNPSSSQTRRESIIHEHRQADSKGLTISSKFSASCVLTLQTLPRKTQTWSVW